MKPGDIRGEVWHIRRTVKTRDQISVPLNAYALAIIERYRARPGFIPVLNQPTTNRYLKELGKMASIDDLVTTTRYRGTERVEETKHKYGYIGTHTARRTFVTLSLEMGLRPEIVMSITGHKDYATFKRYVRITEQVAQSEMRRAWDRK